MTVYQLPAIPTVDAIALEARARAMTRRSIKSTAKAEALKWIVRMIDLTTLEGADTPGRVHSLCQKALRPLPGEPVPPVAAVCVYPSRVADARRSLGSSPVEVASVATSFPSGQSFSSLRHEEVREARAAGADEIDIVIDRAAFLAGQYDRVFAEVQAAKEAADGASLKVILETGELETYDLVRRASQIAIDAGADFIKTSTGKISQGSSLPVALVMLETIRDHFLRTGNRVGLKVAGGIRTAKQAWHYLALVKETVGDAWLSPRLFRIGASSLLDDVLLQWTKVKSGRYGSVVYLSRD